MKETNHPACMQEEYKPYTFTSVCVTALLHAPHFSSQLASLDDKFGNMVRTLDEGLVAPICIDMQAPTEPARNMLQLSAVTPAPTPTIGEVRFRQLDTPSVPRHFRLTSTSGNSASQCQ